MPQSHLGMLDAMEMACGMTLSDLRKIDHEAARTMRAETGDGPTAELGGACPQQ